MTNRWKRLLRKQLQNPNFKRLVEKELGDLRLGIQIARLRKAARMSQTKLAARAAMSAPKISAIENRPRNLRVGTLVRLAHALDSRLEIRLIPNRPRDGKRARRVA